MPGSLERLSIRDERLTLADGTDIVVRPIAPRDAQALVRFHARLSQGSITRRYFYPHLVLAASEVAHLTEVDGWDRVALVVEGGGELIAVGRYDRLADATRAEVAFVVADAFQHHGIGTMLLQRLAALARDAGITHLVAEVLAENRAMLSVFHVAGFPTESKTEWGTVELTMTIGPTTAMTAVTAVDQMGTCQHSRVPPPSAT